MIDDWEDLLKVMVWIFGFSLIFIFLSSIFNDTLTNTNITSSNETTCQQYITQLNECNSKLEDPQYNCNCNIMLPFILGIVIGAGSIGVVMLIWKTIKEEGKK
jgi:hypothetical protein